jgi:hypothetical protein
MAGRVFPSEIVPVDAHVHAHVDLRVDGRR